MSLDVGKDSCFGSSFLKSSIEFSSQIFLFSNLRLDSKINFSADESNFVTNFQLPSQIYL